MLFGSESGDDTDKFAQCAWHTGPEGMPILDLAPAWFVGKVLSRFDMGDHVGHLLEPVAAHAPDSLEDLVMFSGVRDIKPGHPA